MASTTLVVYDGEMIDYRGKSSVLGIGTGNFTSEKYLNEKGVETRRPTAGLWLFIRGRSDTSAFQRTHAGQWIKFNGFKIQVLTVGSDRRSMYVKIEVENAI